MAAQGALQIIQALSLQMTVGTNKRVMNSSDRHAGEIHLQLRLKFHKGLCCMCINFIFIFDLIDHSTRIS